MKWFEQAGPTSQVASTKTSFLFDYREKFAALCYPNYRMWFVGQLISLTGSWMQTTAQGFLIYEMTKSPAYLGYIGLASGLPSWIFMLYAGVMADRLNKRKLLIATQSIMMMMSLLLALLTFLHIIQPWHLIILSFIVGIVTAFDAPTRQSFILEMVDRHHLGNAIALNSTLFNLAIIIGPALSGLVYSLVGPAWCFFINAFSFTSVIYALMIMKIRPHVPPKKTSSAYFDLKEGLKFVLSHPQIKKIMMIMGIVNAFGVTFITLMPAWSGQVFGHSATTNGILQSARGIGALLGAVMIVMAGSMINKEKVLKLGHLIFPILLIILSFSQSIFFSVFLLIGAGWGLMILSNMANHLVQILVPDHLRGRVMGIYALTVFGTLPLGALGAGIMAEIIGAPRTIFLSALITLLYALYIHQILPGLFKYKRT